MLLISTYFIEILIKFGVLDLPLIIMGFRVNSCEVSHFTEGAFKDVLKISFVTQFVNSRYDM